MLYLDLLPHTHYSAPTCCMNINAGLAPQIIQTNALRRLSDTATAQQHIEALLALLEAAVVAQNGNWDASPPVPQLALLLSCLLSSAPVGLMQAFGQTRLQASVCMPWPHLYICSVGLNFIQF